jgi:NifU-like protein involved in Fe-S cluster formation
MRRGADRHGGRQVAVDLAVNTESHAVTDAPPPEDPRYHPEVVRRVRELPGAGATPDEVGWIAATAGSVASGALIELSLRIEGERIRAARFRAYGCPHVIASASWLTERLVGSTREKLEAWDWREAQAALNVPPARFGRLLTLQDAVRAAARNWPASQAV